MATFLDTYYADHLAGATGAISLVERLQRLRPDAAWLAALHADLVEAHLHLEALVVAHGSAPSAFKRATTWLGEKGFEAKMGLDALASSDAAAWFEALETLLVGLSGQAALWRVLGTLPAGPGVPTPDEAATREAVTLGWAERVDAARLAAAPAAFAA